MNGHLPLQNIPIRKIDVSAFTIPTDSPESDGTLQWDKTTIVLVEIHAGDSRGLGYTYAHASAAVLIRDLLSGIVCGRSATDVNALWIDMVRAIRNLGRPGIASTAISAVDIALWDLKARVLELPLVRLIGAVREEVPIYGSGGFTSYSCDTLQNQFSEWVHQGISMVKMKVGRHPENDVDRVRCARNAIGPKTQLFVDANGAYSRKQALKLATQFREFGVTWFEEPVTSDDLEGLRLLRDRSPSGMEIAAGEYGYDATYFRRMLGAGAVDVLQADATRCGGFTGFLNAAAQCAAHSLPLSAHTAPLVHMHIGCAAAPVRHVEHFHDHVRIEKLLFDGVVEPRKGMLRPDLARPGLGVDFRRADAEKYEVA